LLCLNSLAQVANEPVTASSSPVYTYERIDVPGVDFLALTASSDFEDYAGYTKSADGAKEVAFTLIDGVFTTYDFPGSQNTYFYALGNDGKAAGHYQDSSGLYHGVILENGELRQYDFPGAVETEIYGISDATGRLTGNFIDDSGVRRGFSGDRIIEGPDSSETYADFVDGLGNLVGSYVGKDGLYYTYVLTPNGRFLNAPVPPNFEYTFVHGINDTGAIVSRSKAKGDIPRSYVIVLNTPHELQFPDSVITEGWNINADGSVVGFYDLADGRRHGFIARPIENSIGYVDETDPVIVSPVLNYTFERIDIPSVELLEITAINNLEDYAGNIRNPNEDKTVGFTLTGGVLKTYDFPGSKNTFFYGLSNGGITVGYFEDNEGLNHGVILVNDELQQYDFPGAVQTSIHSINATTGELVGSFIDTSGVRRGFAGNKIFEYPDAVATYAYVMDAWGTILGSYIDVDGAHRAYAYRAGGYISIELAPTTLEYFSVHGISGNIIDETGATIIRYKAAGDIPRSFVSLSNQRHELRFPGSVRTEVRNVNLKGSVVGHYESRDGRRHAFIARLAAKTESDHFDNIFNVTLPKGLNMLSVPLVSPKSMTAKSLAGIAGATVVIALDAENQRFIAWTPDAPDAGFPIEGGKGYIVNVPQTRNFAFVGAPWINQAETAAAPTAISTGTPQAAWAFVVNGHLVGKPTFDGY